MKNITILSGKGGTGKSSITASLAVILSRNKKIICADCDVDASNLALVFGIKEKSYQEWKELSTAQIAKFDYNKCGKCRKCFENCYFKAIEFISNKPVLKKFSCEGCGVCELVCPNDAVKLIDINNAKIGWAETKYGFKIISSQLKIGESGSGKIVVEVKKKAKDMADKADVILIDSAAGIGCPVIASVTGSDYCVLVVEPTPSGIFDMKRAYDIVKHFKISCGIIINKFDLNKEHYKNIEKFASDNNLNILGKLPYDKIFSNALVNMTPVVEINKAIKKIFFNIANNILKEFF
jgi:MinD superfamily P-loop ATPase